MERMSRVTDPNSKAGIATRLHILPVASLHICLSKGARVGERDEMGREQFLSDEKWVLTLTAARSESLTCAIQDGFAEAGNLGATCSFAGFKNDPWVA